MKKSSLVSKLLLTFSAIIGISFIIIATIVSVWLNRYVFQEKRNLFDKQAELISEAAISHQNVEDNSSDLNGAINMVSNSTDTQIILTDAVGVVYNISNSANDEYSKLLYTQLNIKNADTLRQGYALEDKNAKSRVSGESKYVYYKPIVSNDIFKGVIIMETPLANIKKPLDKIYLIIWLTAMLALIFSNIVIYYFSEKILIKPLDKINNGAKKLTKGDIENRVEIQSNDEIGELAESFNIMADSLEEVEKNRREFISNVSHELRSPITSIRGFISGILDGVIPKDKENYYLNIVNDEIQRLTRLINDLLDLSVIQAGKFKLKITEVNINEIIKVCVMNCEQKIKDKNLNVEVTLSGQHLDVLADRDRMLQVVTNLLDNAVKYCGEGGNIKINTRWRVNKVYVSIYNDGPAIAENEIPYIWDRFYKSDKSRTNKVSTGLGLPIVRNILVQHGEDIWVENKTSQQGVMFTFTLKKA